jgi:predicted  nucleic acid-binding Zn-ribbon protein
MDGIFDKHKQKGASEPAAKSPADATPPPPQPPAKSIFALRGVGRQLLLTMTLFVLAAGNSAAQNASTRNGRWDAIRNQQLQLEQIATSLGVAVSARLSSAWNSDWGTEESLVNKDGQLEDEEGRLLAQERRIREEDAGLVAQYYRFMDNRAALEAERVQLQHQIDSESVRLNTWYRRIMQELASGGHPPYQEYNAQAVKFNTWSNSVAADWNNRRDEYNDKCEVWKRQQRDLESRFAEWKTSCSGFAARKASYVSRLQTWEQDLDELIGLQDAEAQRLREVAEAQARKPPAMDRPKPAIDGAVGSQVDAQVGQLPARTAYNAALHVTDAHGGAFADIVALGAEAAGMHPAVMGVVMTEKAAIHLMEAATKAEERRTKAETEKLRQLPDVIRHIDQRKRELDRQVRRREITDDDRRRALGAFARREAGKYGFLAANQENRLWDDLTSPEARWSIGESLSGVGFNVLAKAGPVKEALGGMGEDAARLMRCSEAGVKSTKLLFQRTVAGTSELAVEHLVHELGGGRMKMTDQKLKPREAGK